MISYENFIITTTWNCQCRAVDIVLFVVIPSFYRHQHWRQTFADQKLKRKNFISSFVRVQILCSCCASVCDVDGVILKRHLATAMMHMKQALRFSRGTKRKWKFILSLQSIVIASTIVFVVAFFSALSSTIIWVKKLQAKSSPSECFRRTKIADKHRMKWSVH